MDDKDLYIIAMMNYKKENSRFQEEDLFPLGWHANNNYHLKIEIIAEALQNHVLIKNTQLYQTKFIYDKCKISNDSSSHN